jgi:hypothetical protein
VSGDESLNIFLPSSSSAFAGTFLYTRRFKAEFFFGNFLDPHQMLEFLNIYRKEKTTKYVSDLILV